jgi:hypothetical protein
MVRYGAWREAPFPDPGELRPRAARRATPPPAHCPQLSLQRGVALASAGLI